MLNQRHVKDKKLGRLGMGRIQQFILIRLQLLKPKSVLNVRIVQRLVHEIPTLE